MLPVITISRQYGSGGHEVGEKVAQKLNLPFYDKALIAMAAKKSGLSEEVFADADEKATSSLLYSMVMGSYAFGARVPGINEMPINDKLFLLQAAVVYALDLHAYLFLQSVQRAAIGDGAGAATGIGVFVRVKRHWHASFFVRRPQGGFRMAASLAPFTDTV